MLQPLKRVGERGSGEWRRVAWDDALDVSAARLSQVIARYGPEGMVVSTSQWNTCTETGAGRRFMNLFGAPNWISGVALCPGNTAAINRMVYGWYPQPGYRVTQCILLFGHNPRRHSWTPIYDAIRRAQTRGAKLIVLDPRRSESAERADLWLPLRVGTDAAMCFGWLNVIFEEKLYDEAFVQRWTMGCDALRRRVAEFPLARVARITGADPERISAAARMYATNWPVETLRTRAPHLLGDWVQRHLVRRLLEEGRRETSLILSAGCRESGSGRVSVESDRVSLAARRLYERRCASRAARRAPTVGEP